MVKAQPTRKVVAELKAAGWVAVRTVGSHTVWRSPDGRTISIADGHRTTTPGVYRQVLKALRPPEEGD